MQQLHELHELQTARMAAVKPAPITPTHAEFCPVAEPSVAKPEAKEPELRDVLANTSWSSILLPFALGLVAIAISLAAVFASD